MSQSPTDGAAGSLSVSPRRRHRLLVQLLVAGTAAALASLVVVLPRLTAVGVTPSPIIVSGLVGTWAVAASGESPETRLRVDMSELQIWRACGRVDGSWKATPGGAFLSSFSFWFGGCYPDGKMGPQSDPAIAWVSQAHALRSTGNGWELLGADGHPLARLTPGSRPTVPTTMAHSEADPPTLTDEERRSLDAPVAQLPAGLSPLTMQLVTGTWVPKDGSPGFVTMTEDGRYVGNDGCNDASGTWAVDYAGHLLVAGKIFVTLEDCAGKAVDRELTGAGAVGLEGATLVVYGPGDSASGGVVVDRLVHGTPVPRVFG